LFESFDFGLAKFSYLLILEGSYHCSFSHQFNFGFFIFFSFVGNELETIKIFHFCGGFQKIFQGDNLLA
jgi:hypothetical protein